jgi:outer membrane protein OmpU
MKKLLLGTSALVAVGLCASEASAQGYATLGGFVREYFQVYDHDSIQYNNGATQTGAALTNSRDLTLTSNSEFYARGETKLNNGMIFGFRIEVEAWTQNGSTSAQSIDQIDEHWLYVKGSFGEIRLGEEDDARKLKAYSSYISPYLAFGVDSPDGVWSLGTSTTYYNVENDSQKILYFSPSFGGFSFAASYAPDAVHGSLNFAHQGRADCLGVQARGCNSEAWSIAADYRGKFGDTTFGADIGYTGSNSETTGAPNVSAWRADAFVQIAGIEASIQYGKQNDARGAGLDDSAIGGALMYTMGPWTFGGFFQQGRSDISTGGTNKLNHFAVAAGYILGGGVGLGAIVGHQKRNNATGVDPSATTLIFGIGATF